MNKSDSSLYFFFFFFDKSQIWKANWIVVSANNKAPSVFPITMIGVWSKRKATTVAVAVAVAVADHQQQWQFIIFGSVSNRQIGMNRRID